jgi:hypothetical protein
MPRDLEKKREYQRKHHAANLEKYRESNRKYRAAHREELNALHRKRYAENPEKALVRTREYSRRRRVEHPDKTRRAARKWREGNPERVREYQRKADLRRKYGLAVEEYDAMVAAQDGRCAICGEIPSGSRSVLDVDHDHATGTVRGLLCHGCNKATGFLHDNPELLQKAINYLRRTA